MTIDEIKKIPVGTRVLYIVDGFPEIRTICSHPWGTSADDDAGHSMTLYETTHNIFKYDIIVLNESYEEKEVDIDIYYDNSLTSFYNVLCALFHHFRNNSFYFRFNNSTINGYVLKINDEEDSNNKNYCKLSLKILYFYNNKKVDFTLYLQNLEDTVINKGNAYCTIYGVDKIVIHCDDLNSSAVNARYCRI